MATTMKNDTPIGRDGAIRLPLSDAKHFLGETPLFIRSASSTYLNLDLRFATTSAAAPTFVPVATAPAPTSAPVATAPTSATVATAPLGLGRGS